ncbi:carcinine transporter-like isoform X2 [Cydia pomonella]|uniref:carcinine transporter-like isoform X2 n=1 Tax=Cydia pomonella TaxID=82600 RepID=UPI002ADD37B9|nr:carcinine transporter-like isoform X2 [Cydia pomonella]
MESHEKVGAALDMAEPKKRVKDFDDLLPLVGEFGWYQRLLFLMMIPYAFFFAFVYFGQIFMTLVPEQHWCYVEELQNMTVEQRRHLSIPRLDEKYHKCQVYDVDWMKVIQDGVTEPDTKWPTKKCEKQWEYNFTDVPYQTIATQLNWVCDEDNKGATAQSIFFCGAIVGGLLFGWIADKYGRVPALVVIEYVGLKWRTFVSNMSIAVYFTFAACMLPWIALGVADWRVYTLVISVPLVLAVFTPCLVPESARWLISQGRIEESIKILQKCGKVNGKKLPDDIIKEFRETAAELAKSEQEVKNYSALDLFKTPRLRKHSILLVLIWCCTAMVFDGHVRNVGSLGLDMFLTFTVATATEFPADVLLISVLDILGRRWLAFGSMVISGIFSFLATTVAQGIPSASLAIVGRFAVNISYNIGMQYAAELLPTVVRAQGLALIHITGYVATILVPYIVYMATIAVEIPLLILGALGILGGTLCLFLPESMGKAMPQTIQDGENYGLGQRFWEFPCCGRKNLPNKEDVETVEKY